MFFSLLTVCVFAGHRVMYVTYLPLGWRPWVRKACWLARCEIQPDVAGYPGSFGILHVTHFILGHTKSFSHSLNSLFIWILRMRVTQGKMAIMPVLALSSECHCEISTAAQSR